MTVVALTLTLAACGDGIDLSAQDWKETKPIGNEDRW